MQSVMTHQFSRVPKATIPRSSFDRSHGHKTTFDAGLLVPIFIDEVLPGDSFNLQMTGFARLATPLFPIMDNLRMETFFFFVPTRLLWSNWEKFNGAQDNPGDSISFTIPLMTAHTPAVMSLSDYLGLPTRGLSVSGASALPFRAYNKIFNDWFKDQNLQNDRLESMGDAADTIANFTLQNRGKRHDYFTSCLPWPQKGTSVPLPLAGTAPVLGIGSVSQTYTATSPTVYESDNTTSVFGFYEAFSTVGDILMQGTAATGGYPNVRADLSLATATTVNVLRQAFQIQKLLERDARGGTRYIEILKSHFGVTSPDFRLQRPEYLGGGSSPVIITPVTQTSASAGAEYQGSMAAYGTASLHGHGFTRSFVEHGYIMGLVNVRADLTYQQGLERFWSRQTRYDFYWPSFATIGEQAVLNKEIYYNNDANDNLVFGYQERGAEYRYKPSRISGLFRSDAAGTLDAWHLSQDFASVPLLNATFIQDTPPVDRVIAVPAEPHFIFDSFFSLRCARPMPLFGVPGLIDHF